MPIIPLPPKIVRDALGEDVVDALMEWLVGVLNRPDVTTGHTAKPWIPATHVEVLGAIDPPPDVRRTGRAWAGGEGLARYRQTTPERIEMVDGRLLNSEGERIRLLLALLENVGVDVAIRLGDPEVWKRAAADL